MVYGLFAVVGSLLVQRFSPAHAASVYAFKCCLALGVCWVCCVEYLCHGIDALTTNDKILPCIAHVMRGEPKSVPSDPLDADGH